MPLLDSLRLLFQARPPRPGALTSELAVADTREGSIGLAAGRRGRSDFTWPRYNPDELAARKGGLRVYDAMRVDEQVKACLALKKFAVVGPGWRLRGRDGDPGSEELAGLLTEQLDALPGTFEDVLLAVLSALDYGFSVSEKVFALDPFRLVAVKGRAPHHFLFHQDVHGNVQRIEQLGGPTDLPPAKLIHFVHDDDFDNPYGMSDLRAAYRPWWHKQNVLQFWNVWMEKLADQPPVVRYPRGTSSAKIDEALEVLNHLQARTSLAFPADWEVSLLESSRNPREVFQAAVDRHDLGIAKALLVPDKLGIVGGEVQAGSLALSKTQLGIFFFVVDLVARRLRATVQEQVVNQVSAFVAPSTPPPELVLLPLTEDDKFQVATVFQTLVTGGVFGTDLEDENHLRRLMGFAEKDEAAVRRREEAAARRRTTVVVPGDPDDGGDDDDDPNGTDDDSAQFAAHGHPAMAPVEARADMAEKLATFEAATPLLAEGLAEGMTLVVDDLKRRVRRAGLLEPGATPAAVRALRPGPKVVAAMRERVRQLLVATHARATTEARGELARARKPGRTPG